MISQLLRKKYPRKLFFFKTNQNIDKKSIKRWKILKLYCQKVILILYLGNILNLIFYSLIYLMIHTLKHINNYIKRIIINYITNEY